MRECSFCETQLPWATIWNVSTSALPWCLGLVLDQLVYALVSCQCLRLGLTLKASCASLQIGVGLYMQGAFFVIQVAMSLLWDQPHIIIHWSWLFLTEELLHLLYWLSMQTVKNSNRVFGDAMCLFL